MKEPLKSKEIFELLKKYTKSHVIAGGQIVFVKEGEGFVIDLKRSYAYPKMMADEKLVEECILSLDNEWNIKQEGAYDIEALLFYNKEERQGDGYITLPAHYELEEFDLKFTTPYAELLQQEKEMGEYIDLNSF
jgi:hypothetical protein